MARNRVIYQSEGLYVSKEATSTAVTDHFHLSRVQSANYNFNIARQDINQYGDLARIDSIVIEAPTVALDFSYYITDGSNERKMGFDVVSGGQATTTAPQFVGGHITGGSGRNYFIVTSNEGVDLNGLSGTGVGGVPTGLSGRQCIGIGNAYLTDYSVEFAVGSIPTATVSFEAANLRGSNISGSNSGTSPAINTESGTTIGSSVVLPNPSSDTTGTNVVTALRPGDITVNFGNFGTSGILTQLTGVDALHLQSLSLSIPLSRSQIQRLGSKFAYARNVDFPVNATISLNGVQNEIGSGSLMDLLDSNPKTDMTITINRPTGGSVAAVRYIIRRAQLDSSSVSSSIGSNKTVDLTFSTQIGGLNDQDDGITMSGSYTSGF
jgi:hypothetical protein